MCPLFLAYENRTAALSLAMYDRPSLIVSLTICCNCFSVTLLPATTYGLFHALAASSAAFIILLAFLFASA